jgi:hypothetical protein
MPISYEANASEAQEYDGPGGGLWDGGADGEAGYLGDLLLGSLEFGTVGIEKLAADIIPSC